MQAFHDSADTASLPHQNIYQMYVGNGNKVGFFVQRESWGNTYAQVVEIDGRSEGPLPGKPPYHGNPEVKMDVFNMNGTLRQRNQRLSCPGNYSYRLVVPEK